MVRWTYLYVVVNMWETAFVVTMMVGALLTLGMYSNTQRQRLREAELKHWENVWYGRGKPPLHSER